MAFGVLGSFQRGLLEQDSTDADPRAVYDQCKRFVRVGVEEFDGIGNLGSDSVEGCLLSVRPLPVRCERRRRWALLSWKGKEGNRKSGIVTVWGVVLPADCDAA